MCVIAIYTQYSDWLRAGRSWDRIPVEGDIFRTCPGRPWDTPSLLYNGYRVFPGGKEWPGRDADPSPLLVPWSRKSRAIPLQPLWTVRPVQSLSACTRVHFTFYSDSLRAGRSGDRIPVWCEIFRTRPYQTWGPPGLLYKGCRVFTGSKVAGA